MIEKIAKSIFSKKIRKHLNDNIEKAGMDLNIITLFQKLLFFSFFLSVAGLIYVNLKFPLYAHYSSRNLVIVLLSAFIIMLFLGFIASFLFFLIVLNLKVHERKKEIELVLPNFLQLVSSNVRAGMPIDKAMWLSIRPRFGVLAKEIENAAKETMTGKELEHSLKKLGEKYDSPLLQRTVNLIIEGMKAGGEIGDLLDRIATDIQETHLIREEMAENVTTYVIFISFTVILAAPALFGLSYGLLTVIQSITGSLAEVSTSSSNMPISFSGPGISMDDFKIFAITSLTLTSFFSTMIISTIKKGNSKEGLKSFPVFAAITIMLFLVMTKVVVYVFDSLL